jgi:hypothetical protein
MKLKVLLMTILAFSLNAQAQAQSSRRPVQLNQRSVAPTSTSTARGQVRPIRRVILYSNGVAYIERRGTVSGHAEVDLSFKQSQVDDVLKSMVVLDLGQGRIGAVSYNSSAPPNARMTDIPFSIAPESADNAQGGLAGVLSQLQGARVVVATATRTVVGSILTVEECRSQIDASKPPVITHAVVIAGEKGELMSFDLAEVRAIRLVDEGARRDVNEFASATASARRRDAKTITVTSDGAGAREMVVSYTIAAPIWKTTYRVVLDDAGKPFFQGWAIVDNVSEEDWNDIQLSLISGTPVSFIQPIQKPFYRYRPVVPITDSSGNFRTSSLISGSYTVTISSQGFNQYVLSGVRVSPVRPRNIRAPLSVASVSETVNTTNRSRTMAELRDPIFSKISNAISARAIASV